MSDDREKLKALLLSEEMAQIQALQKLLNDKQQFSQKVSEVLDTASDLAIADNPTFQKKFSKIDSQSYVRAIKANKQTFIDALLPIIGPMIRKSVTSSIRRFVADINNAIEMGISAKALKWRWIAFRTGVPFAEIVFNNTIEYQVQQVLLIDNNSGLLIEHAGHEELLLQDKDAMSAMLTAIQDFVKDSVSNDGEGLTAAELDDSLVWLVHGNQANMAVVIKGAPTQRLHDTIDKATEDIHIEFHQELEDQNLWNNSPELKVELEKLLITKSQSDDQDSKKSINFWPWLLLLLGLLGLLCWWGWSSYQQRQLQQQISIQLNQTPGFVLSDLQYHDGRFIASGLQDPLTDFSDLDERVSIQSTPFISLDDTITARRVKAILNDSNLSVAVENQTVTINGSTKKTPELLQTLIFLTMLPGVNKVTDLSTNKDWQAFIMNNPPPNNIHVEEIDKNLHLSGATTQQRLDDFINSLQQFGAVDTTAVEIYSYDKLQQFIANNPVTLVNPNNINPQQAQHLDKIYQSYFRLSSIKNNVKIKLIAQSDCQGSVIESNELNQSRLNLVENYLINAGINEQFIMTELTECTMTTDEIDTSKIGVWFEVLP